MKEVTEGIVLRKTPFSENSLVIQLLTPQSGIRSFLFKGAKRAGKGGQIFSPLAVVSLETHTRNESELSIVSSANLSVIFKSIPFDPVKASVLFFVNELLLNAVHDQEETGDLYQYTKTSLVALDHAKDVANFPVKVLCDLIGYLGFFPNTEGGGKIFDLREATLVSSTPDHDFFLDESHTSVFLQLYESEWHMAEKIQISVAKRRHIIRQLLNYYKLVIDNWTDLKSLPVLEEIQK